MDRASKKKLEELIAKHCVKKKDGGERIISYGGTRMTWMFDIRSIFLNADALELVSDLFWDTYQNKYPFQVAGQEISSIPLLAAISLGGKKRNLPINAFVLRKERKTTGLQRVIEGGFEQNTRTILVDDLINSGKTIVRQLAVLKEHNMTPSDVFILVNLQNTNDLPFISDNKISLVSLFFAKDFGVTPPTPAITDSLPVEVRWWMKFKTPNYFYERARTQPVIDSDRLYVGLEDNFVRCMQKDTGKIIWQHKVARGPWRIRAFSNLVIDQNAVYFASRDGNIYALDKLNGTQKWAFYGGDWAGSELLFLKEKKILAVSIQTGFRGQRSGIVILNSTNGNVIGFYKTESPVITPLLQVEATKIVAATRTGILFCMDIEKGNFLWKIPLEDSITNTLTYDPHLKNILVGGTRGEFKIIDATTGVTRAAFPWGREMIHAPFVDNARYYISAGKRLYCIDSKLQKELWHYDFWTKIASPQLDNEKNIWIGSNSGELYRLNPTHKELQFFQGVEQIPVRPTFDSSHENIYFTTAGNEIFCLRKQQSVNRSPVPQSIEKTNKA